MFARTPCTLILKSIRQTAHIYIMSSNLLRISGKCIVQTATALRHIRKSSLNEKLILFSCLIEK